MRERLSKMIHNLDQDINEYKGKRFSHCKEDDTTVINTPKINITASEEEY